MHYAPFTRHTWMLAILCALVVIPVAVACVIPRNLTQQVGLAGDEIAIGTVTSVREVWLDEGAGETFPWTVVDFDVAESFVKGQTGPIQMIARGGLEPGSPSTSVTPSPEDLKAGRRLLVFLGNRAFESQELGSAAPYQIFSFAEVYRIETVETRTGVREVLLGSGTGMAFPSNVEIDQARADLRAAIKATGGEKR
jgi:hypothetical protein